MSHMRQIWITKAGRPETLVVKQAPDPEPRAGEVRIRVEASGVNFADIMGRMGLYPDCPPIPVVVGYEVGGRVDAVGTGADPNWIGRDVFAVTRFGGYSDVVCVPEIQVFARPSGMSAFEGAALPVNYLTAWQLVVVMGGLKAGETMLVHSAGGGVGIAAMRGNRRTHGRQGHRRGFRLQTRASQSLRRRPFDRLSTRRFRGARERDNKRSGR